jgi:hypothetical protein
MSQMKRGEESMRRKKVSEEAIRRKKDKIRRDLERLRDKARKDKAMRDDGKEFVPEDFDEDEKG